MQPKIELTNAGVIVARFQGDDLHEGQRTLIEYVKSRHKKVAVFIGIAPVKVTRNNPLDYFTRKVMVEQAYPSVHVFPIKDVGSDEAWSKELDKKIKEVFDLETVTLYGSRDSFIPHYKGIFHTVELDSSFTISNSEVRALISDDIRKSPDFRAGVIYAAYNMYPKTYQTVDIVITKLQGDLKEVLLARKKVDKASKWRFIGGFVDPRLDKSLEDAAEREAYEETGGLAIHSLKYFGSTIIDDWRYRNEVDKIMTAVFTAEYTYGHAKASDDIDELEWVPLKKLLQSNSWKEVLVEEHLPIFEMVFKNNLPQMEVKNVK